MHEAYVRTVDEAVRARGAITKTGNAYVRRVLVEAAWHYPHHPFIGKQLRHRQEAAPDPAKLHAWRAQQRLYSRYQRLAARESLNSASSPQLRASSPASSGRP